MWSPIIKELSDSYRCYCIDTITDANKSMAVLPIGNAADYVSWLQEMFSALGLARARVIGFSYGGWLAALLALQAPERVSHLVLLSPAATLAPLPAQFFARILASGLLRSNLLACCAMQWLSATPEAISDPVVELIANNLTACRPLRREMMPPTVLTDDELRRLTARVTVFIGDKEVIYRCGPEAATARARKHIPNVHMQLMANAKHMLTLDCTRPLSIEILAALEGPASDQHV